MSHTHTDTDKDKDTFPSCVRTQQRMMQERHTPIGTHVHSSCDVCDVCACVCVCVCVCVSTGLSSGANDYVVKPFGRTEILARIATHLSFHEKTFHVSHTNTHIHTHTHTHTHTQAHTHTHTSQKEQQEATIARPSTTVQ